MNSRDMAWADARSSAQWLMRKYRVNPVAVLLQRKTKLGDVTWYLFTTKIIIKLSIFLYFLPLGNVVADITLQNLVLEWGKLISYPCWRSFSVKLGERIKRSIVMLLVTESSAVRRVKVRGLLRHTFHRNLVLSVPANSVSRVPAAVHSRSNKGGYVSARGFFISR